MEDEGEGKANDQQEPGEGGVAGDKDENPLISSLEHLFWQAKSEKLEKRQFIGKLLIIIFQDAVKWKFTLNPEDVFRPLERVFYDPESTVRSSLVECLPHVALICQEAPYLFGDGLMSRILNLVLIYLRDVDNQVRQDAQTALSMLLERDLLDDEQIENDVCNVIIELSKDECSELRTLALTLMTKVNPYIGDELTEKLFLDRFLELSQSKGFFIRRVCASIMGDFCTIMSKETVYNKLLMTYANLCRDSVWGVRKTAVDVMMLVARCVPLQMRRDLLSKLLVRHLCDESRWVRHSAYEILGPFISTFAKQFHKLICDNKGELVIVHESERGWPRFNVVPVAKVSDILTDNLSRSPDDYFWKRNHIIRNNVIKRPRVASKGSDEYSDKVFEREFEKFRKKEMDDRRNANDSEEYEKFNLFQFYYDPPDSHLDPALVESIITENSTTTTPTPQNYSGFENTDLDQNQTDWDVKNDSFDLTNQNNSGNDNSNAENDQQGATEDVSNNVQNQEQKDDNENKPDSPGSWRRNLIYDGYAEVISIKESEDPFKESGRDDEGNENKTSQRQDSDEENLDTLCDKLLADENSLFNNSQPPNISPLSSYYNEKEEELDNDEIVPRILVDYFVSMAELQSSTNDAGPDLDYHCAFSFPAVVLTLGKDNWHRLKDAYQRLASAVAWKVRSTLASSIHEIAIIIEKDFAARDLVPIYNGFIKDLDEVRIGALKHFSTFLKVLSPQDRMLYLPKLNDFLITDNKWNWRLREELVKQLSEIIHLYQRIDVAQYIAPLLLHLLQDRVAAVRQEAVDTIAKTVGYLENQNDDPLAVAMIQEMRDLLMSHAAERWIIRQTYVLVCSKLVKTEVISAEIFARELLPYLLELSNDKVPNVRLVVARAFASDFIKIRQNPEFPNAEVQQKLKVMQSDSDRDVRLFASEIEIDKFY